MMKTNVKLCLTAAALVVGYVSPVDADSATDRGREIAVATDKADEGWGDFTVSLKMVLKNSQNQVSTRELRTKSLEVFKEGFGDKSQTIFDLPRDVKGTVFLSHTKALKADDQWLYLPALKRVKRISSANKSGPFLGSEFAYEDLLSPELSKYSYRYLRDEACAEFTCFVIERTPLYENSGYTKQIVWIDKDHHRYMKIDFYDRKEAHLKTLTFSGYSQYLDKYWRPKTMEMVNHQLGKATTLKYDSYEFRTGLTKADFTAARLKRTR